MLTQTMLTNVSVAFIYREAKFGSETISQSLLGEEVTVLKSEGEWRYIRQHDDYEGWIGVNFLCEKPASWDDHERFTPKSQISWIHQSPDRASATFRDITLLSSLPVIDHQSGWVKLLLPDGLVGWMEDNPAHIPSNMDLERLLATALQFLGIQYFWGGRSPKGFDCSGFIQSIFNLNGLQLPRDAYLQAEMGEQISDNYETWEVGDLIFFSERPAKITHVALSLGAGDFIHASGFVKLNSINPLHADLYIEKYAKIFTKTMRVI